MIEFVENRARDIKLKLETLKDKLPEKPTDLKDLASKLHDFQCPKTVSAQTWKDFKNDKTQNIEGKKYQIQNPEDLPNNLKLSVWHSLTFKKMGFSPYPQGHQFTCKYRYKSTLSGDEYTIILKHTVEDKTGALIEYKTGTLTKGAKR